MTTENQVSERFLAKQAIDEETENPQDKKAIIPGRFLDLANLVIAYDAYLQFLETSQIKPDAKSLARGTNLIRRFADDVVEGIRLYILPLGERPDTGSLRSALMRGQRAGTPTTVVRYQAEMLRLVLPWLRTRAYLLNDIFPGRVARAARDLAALVEEASPATRLNKSALIPPVSGINIPRAWIEKVAGEVGMPLTATESSLVGAVIAKGLGEDLAKVESSISAVTPNTAEAADLQEQRTGILAQIDQVASDSKDRPTILAAVAMATPTTQYATETGKRLGHTPDQEDAMAVRGRALIAAGAGSGKCIRGDTLVQTEKCFIPIEELCAGLEAEQESSLQIYINGISGPEQTSHSYYDGVRETLRIETTQGYEIEGTAKHRILTLQEGQVVWTELQNIQEGDVVCLDRRPGLFAEAPFKREPVFFKTERNTNCTTQIPIELTPQVARLLGYVVSEGYIRKESWGVSISTSDPEQLALYKESIQGLISYQERLDERLNLQYIMEFCRHADIQALLNFGLTREKANAKEIPAGILRSPKPIVTEFLRTLFDGDGCVESSTVSYCTASTKMAEQLHTLLFAYGIPARRKFRPNDKEGAWHLYITGKGLRRFHKEIGFNLKAKQKLLEEQAAKPENTNIDVIPEIEGLCRTIKYQYKDLTGTTKTKDPWEGTAKCICNGSRNPSFTTLKRFLEFYKVESEEWHLLNSLCKEDWFFDRVVGVENSTAEVYDFVVPGTHSFSAGGFINHNTRVLASKVVYHIAELGADPASIMATSFTTKSSAELLSRIEKYGAVIEGPAREGFGTTHSIAGKFLNKKATQFRHSAYIGRGEMWKQTALLRLAMEQVKMGPFNIPTPQPKGLWENKTAPAVELPKAQITPQNQGMGYLEAIDMALRFYKFAAETWKGTYREWAAKQVPFLEGMRLTNPKKLTDRQKEYLNSLFSKVKRDGTPVLHYRIASEGDATVEVTNAPSPLESPKRKQSKMEQYKFFKTPARMWFNLGRKLTRGGGAKTELEPEKAAEIGIPLGEFKNALSILKGSGLSPSEAWAGKGPYPAESDQAAVYAAYEWLKSSQGEPEFAGTGDMDDILIDTVTALVSSPTLRHQMNAQYKIVLIDEAQDLNKTQSLLFGLIAGYINPETMVPWPDKHMTADTFAFIGDSSQAIFEFRGADPDGFTERSDLTSGGDDFKTKLLDTNFRSGQAIVEAANKLIAHNEKRIPMVCKANLDRNGMGRIITRSAGSVGEASYSVADEIQGTMEAAVSGAGRYKDFGVAVRSNAEAYSYGLEMLKRSIPFKSNARFFDDPATKALIGWLTVSEKGLDGPQGELEDAVRDAVRAPYAKLGQAFFTAMNDKADGPWPRWLVDGGAKMIYQREEMVEAAQHFTENLEKVSGISGAPAEVLSKIMDLQGLDGLSMRENLIQAVAENDDLMAELSAQAEGGKVTEEMIMEQALAPINPLISLMAGREDIGSAMTYVRKLRQINSKLATKDTEEEIDRDAVTIGTMHSWKGLEVPTMYVPMVGGKFPRTKKSVEEENPNLWSERRLAYVAITRAEQRCVVLDIPHPSLKDENGAPLHSQFISESCIPYEGSQKPQDGVPKVGGTFNWTDDAILHLSWGTPL